ncbi:MAG: Crp/Fnr family transcriptional regulator [Sphingomonas sp.]|nr:Crp/Fnr family transcriptional regulator [Sphingomonas sp.]
MNHFAPRAFASPAYGRFLARLTAHTKLSKEERQEILGLSGQVAELAAGADIFGPNTAVAHGILVTRGVITQFDEAKDGRRKATSLYVPGEMCGLQSIEYPATTLGLSAFTSCSVIYVPHDQLKRLVEDFPEIRRAFWREMAIEAAIQAKWTGNAVLKDALPRTAHFLCELGHRMEDSGAVGRSNFALKTNQTQLAQAIGLTVVHMNRVLRQLREAELISTDKRMIIVKDWGALADVADFDPSYLHPAS